MNKDEFIQSEKASRDTIDVKRVYIDMAGDLVTGIIFSQIIYWHSDDKKGRERLRVERDGLMWLAKTRKEWWGECRVTPRQVDRAIGILTEKGLIVKDVFKFNNSPTLHIRLNWGVFLPAYESALSGVILKSPVSEINHDESVTSLTETTAETTTEIQSADAEKTASAVVEVRTLVDHKPEYSVGDSKTPDTIPTVPNGDGTDTARNGDDPGGLFDGVAPPPPRQPHPRAELEAAYWKSLAKNADDNANLLGTVWQTERDPRVAQVLVCFSDEFGIRAPKTDSGRKFWRTGAQDLLKEFSGDVARTKQRIAEFAAKRNAGENGYTFMVTSPKSIIGTLVALDSPKIPQTLGVTTTSGSGLDGGRMPSAGTR